MNDNEVCFIICTNDKFKCDECLEYINRLIVPQGYSIDIITINGASSICEAYNAAIQASDSKYKIYLHQDVYIINDNFIAELINVFNRHPKAAMVGMVGRCVIPDTKYLYGHEQYGAVYETGINKTTIFREYVKQGEDVKVLHIDGMLMATSKDLKWREDIFDKWDMYDVSQSLEFNRAGYEVYVPYMDKPWIIHDCGIVNLQDYEEEKNKLLAEYSDFEVTHYDEL